MNFDCRQAIKEKLVYSSTPESYQGPALNIAWGVDKNFMFGAAISLTSVLMNNRDTPIHFHLFTDSIDEDYKVRLQRLVQQYHTIITVYVMDSEGLKVLPCGNAWSHATYFRFIAFEYLSDEIDSLLYIDADVICKGSLHKLCDIDFGDRVAAVILDIDASREYAAQRLNTRQFESDYFNAGVIYANLKAWKAQSFLSTAFNMLMDKNKSFAFFDQDVLNIMFLNKVMFLPRIYDAIYGMKQELKSKDLEKYKEFITDETILIHYIGVTKPWHSWAVYPSAQYFGVAYKASPWSDVPLLEAITPKQFKKKSRHERLQGKTLKSIVSYVGYLIAKLKSK
jgi:UDP-glucose:(galactosyl)LPS alpha-1,2-glucosyltransferase